MSDAPADRDSATGHPAVDGLTVDQGGGPPAGMPWTLHIPGEPDWSADLEHAAPLPRIGERIAMIEADGRRRDLRVTDVVHVVQPSATERPMVAAEPSGPNAIVSDPAPRDPQLLRAGLPRVIAQDAEPET